MSDASQLFALLGQSCDAACVAAIARLIETGPDEALCRINVPAFAARNGLDEQAAVSAFLHAAKLGLFDIAWNVLCPGCGGVLDANTTLRTLTRDAYACSLCAEDYKPTLDEMVEVAFTVSPRVRRIAAHDPDSLPLKDFIRQVYFGSGFDLEGSDFSALIDEVVIESVELPPHEKMILSLQLPAAFVILFDPVTHSVQFIDVKGVPARDRQALATVIDRDHLHNQTIEMKPGPVRIAIENRTGTRVLPTICVAGEALRRLLGKRRRFLTAKDILSSQTFRDLYRTDTLDVDQRLRITSLTFLFTDLRGSTELYERVGDLAAFDIVRAHFSVLHAIVAAEAGAVVKTIGDAVMATFPTPDRALAAAIRMREAMREMNEKNRREDLLLKIGLHEGPCIAVMMNERQDYFGQTVNIASRVQALADSRAIFATAPVVDDSRTASMLKQKALVPASYPASLRGIEREVRVFTIP